MASKKKVKIESQLTEQISGMMENGCTAADIVAVFDSLIQEKADAMKVADMGIIESRDIKVASKQLLADRETLLK